MLFVIIIFGIITTIARSVRGYCFIEYNDTNECDVFMNCNEHLVLKNSEEWDFAYGHQICFQNDNLYGGHRYTFNVKLSVENYDDIIELTQRSNNIKLQVTNLILKKSMSNEMPELKNAKYLTNLEIHESDLNKLKLTNQDNMQALRLLDFSKNKINKIDTEDAIYMYKFNPYKYEDIITLNISHNYLSIIPKNSFKFQSKLEILDLSYNLIETLNVLSFVGANELTFLDISFNEIVKLNFALNPLSKLIELHLNNNKLNLITKSDFENLQDIQILNLSFNLISNIEIDSFQNMQSLQTLIISNNQITQLDVNLFNHIYSLTEVDLSYNVLNDIPIKIFEGNNITEFSVSSNSLTKLRRGTFDGIILKQLTLSYQSIKQIDDFTFENQTNLVKLLLNNNNIEVIGNYAFHSIINLKNLFMSHNQITSFKFDKSDLQNLKYLDLSYNKIKIIEKNDTTGLDNLLELNFQHNLISFVDASAFDNIIQLEAFDFNNNPLSSSFDMTMFRNFHRIPRLSLSYSLITIIRNESFVNMPLLYLNLSHCSLKEIQYNAFSGLSMLEELDLSFNKIEIFSINSNFTGNIRTLLLGSNLIKCVKENTFYGFDSTVSLYIDHNNLSEFQLPMSGLSNLKILDVSENINVQMKSSTIYALNELIWINVSGNKNINISFSEDNIVTNVDLSNTGLISPSKINFNCVKMLSVANLSKNIIQSLEVDTFGNMTLLMMVDLSYNYISDIQPGTFDHLNSLEILELSHNHLSYLKYGCFHGLSNLNELDLSDNMLNKLDAENFHELPNLLRLMIDNNQIEYININEISHSLNHLSIGNNPLPCNLILELMRKRQPYLNVSAAAIVRNVSENIKGITCKNTFGKTQELLNPLEIGSDNLLLDIRNMMSKMIDLNTNSHNNNYYNTKQLNYNDLETISKNISIISNANSEVIKNSVADMANIQKYTQLQTNKTNELLNRILQALLIKKTQNSQPNFTSTNETSGLINYLKNIIDSNQINTNDKIIELENEMVLMKSNQNQIKQQNSNAKRVDDHQNSASTTTFVDICLGFIVVMMLAFVVFKLYKSNLFIRARRSISTRPITETTDSMDL